MERIGEYLVHRLVGEGGMGKVFEAEERLSQRRVALKVLRPELSRSEDGRRMFLNEMRILAQLEHPNVVRSLASFEDDGQLVMVLELLEGRTLRQELTARGRLPWSEAVEVTARIAEALAAAHGREIVHRDLKPENVMLTTISAEGAPSRRGGLALKVMDFGIAKVLEAARATSTQSLGTLQYMSPEQIDARAVDARSDLYALGLLLYETLAGVPPFRSASPRELLNLQCTADPAPFDEEVARSLPRAVETLLRSLLSKDPAGRPASAMEVLERLAPLRPAEGATLGGGDRRSEPPPAVSGARLTAGNAAARTPSHHTLPSGRLPVKDTLALLREGGGVREISAPMALLLVLTLSLVAAVLTVVLRVRLAEPAGASPAASSPQAQAGR